VLRLRVEPFSLPELINDVVGLFLDEARRKGIVLELVTPAPLALQVLGDPQRLRQVLQNLVGNAVKFTPQGSVKVHAHTRLTERDAVELCVEVQDTGVGFDARESARLFQRFSQLTDGTASGGTGLGLAISADLVRLMGGEIDGSSPGRGQGARFSILIPLPLAPPTSDALRGRRVLVVDDNAVNLSVARAYLEGLGVRVDEAAGGEAAIARATAERYDAILMDCQMPGKDGVETTQDLRARGDATPVLAITAADDDSTRARCEDAGMNGFVQKPVSADALRDALSRVLASR
jgi:CheY-like chemotaxis protein